MSVVLAALTLTLLLVGVVLLIALRYLQRAEQPKPESAAAAGGPGFAQSLLPRIRALAEYSRRLPLSGIRERYAHQIERAGLPYELSPDEFIAIKLAAWLALTGFALVVHVAVFSNWAMVAGLSFLGFVYPDLRLAAAVRKHELACMRVLPGFLDLLALSVEAGMGFDAAVRNLTEVLERGPLISRFQSYLREVNVGKTRSEAMRETARRLDLAEFSAFANAVVQAEETGASMAPVLRTASLEVLARRFERAEKAAHELPVKILFPLFVFIFPATFLMILVPLYLQVMAAGILGAF